MCDIQTFFRSKFIEAKPHVFYPITARVTWGHLGKLDSCTILTDIKISTYEMRSKMLHFLNFQVIFMTNYFLNLCPIELYFPAQNTLPNLLISYMQTLNFMNNSLTFISLDSLKHLFPIYLAALMLCLKSTRPFTSFGREER